MPTKSFQIAASRESGVRRRRSTIPREASRAIKQIRTFAKVFADQMDAWDRSLFRWVADATPEELTGELLEQLLGAQRDVSELRNACMEISDKLERCINRVKRVLTLRQERRQGGGRKLAVHESEDVEIAFDPYKADEDAGIKVEGDDEIEDA